MHTGTKKNEDSSLKADHKKKNFRQTLFLSENSITRTVRFSSGMEQKNEKVSLIELAETTMVQSMIVFLLADLRILSATGKLRCGYQSLYIDSDQTRKQYSHDFAGQTPPNYESSGVTSAHIMAILLLEITRAADELRGEDGASSLKEPEILDRKTIKSATSIPTLLGCYRDMMKVDILRGSLKIRKDEFNFSPREAPPIETNVSNVSTNLTSPFNPDVGIVKDDEASLYGLNVIKQRQRIHRAKSVLNVLSEEEKGLIEIEALDGQMFNVADGDSSEFYTKQEVLNLLDEAVDSRDHEKIKIIEKFFKDGSITKSLLQSKAETVWINDWHPAHECTYAISIDKEKNNVLLAFRGAYTRADWSHVLDTKVKATSNPIDEDYPDRSENIKLYSGIHRYLFRVRKDTNTTKYDEITSKLAYYCDLVGDEVRVTVTGHSLGAALTNIFSFYASTNDTFTKNGPIESVTFGGPMVGGYKFADAVRHQEDQDKLRIARFYCVRDGVPRLPFVLFWTSKRGAKYFHNGINVKLPMIRKGIFKIIGQPLPVVAYSGKPKSKIRSWLNQVKSFYLWNIPLRFWLIGKMHSLVEHKDRLLLINKTKNYERSPLVRFSLEELYQMRHDLKREIA